MNLHAVYGEAWSCVKLLMADVAFEMLRLLMLYQNLFIVELSVTVPAPRLGRLLLLASHFFVDCKLGLQV